MSRRRRLQLLLGESDPNSAEKGSRSGPEEKALCFVPADSSKEAVGHKFKKRMNVESYCRGTGDCEASNKRQRCCVTYQSDLGVVHCV